MTPSAAAAVASFEKSAQPTPPPPPATIAGDGPSPRHAVAAAAEDAGGRRGDRHGAGGEVPAAVLGARRARAACARREAGRGPRRERHGHGRLSLHPDRPRPRAGDAVPRRQPVCRAGAGIPGAVQRLRARLHGRAALRGSRPPGDRLRSAHRQQGDVRSAGSGRELRQVAVPVWRARQRQDGRRRRHRPRAWQRDVRAACDRHRRPDDYRVRSGEPRAARRHRRLDQRDRDVGARSALGDRSSGRSWWSAASSRSRCST